MSTVPFELIDEYLRTKRVAAVTERSIRDVLEVVLPALGKPIEDVGSLDVRRWLARAEQAPSTARTRLSGLRGFYRYLVETGRVDRDPTAGIRPPREPRRVPRALSSRDVGRLVATCPSDREVLMVLLGVQEGLRRKEIAGLQLGDVDFEAGTARIVGKGDNERVVPLSTETLTMMRRYLAETRVRSGAIFRSCKDHTRPLQPITIGRLISDLMREAGVKGAAYDGRSLHALRHTAATDMLLNGAHLRDVQRALGHQHLVTTERYLALEVRGLRDAMGGRSYLVGTTER